MNKRHMIVLAGSLCLLLAAAVITGLSHASAANSGNKPIDFTASGPNGTTVKLSDYRGKVVVVDVWATWCGYCVREIPGLIQLQQEAIANKQPVQLIGVSIDKSHGAVDNYMKHTAFNYPVVYVDDPLMKIFGDLPGVPDKFIFNKDGVMMERLVGAMDKADLQKHIDKYLK